MGHAPGYLQKITLFFSLLLTFLLTFLISYKFNFHTYIPIVLSYILSINIVSFILYGSDKFQAWRQGLRIPEFTLLAVVFLGGNMGSYLGRKVFHHKTIKRSFVHMFWGVTLVQVFIICALLYYSYFK